MSDEQIERIAREACKERKKNGSRWNTYFYKVVLAGNDDVIKRVVAYMENNRMPETLDWLLQRNHFKDFTHQHQKGSQRVLWMRGIIMILFTIINIVLTPCFYALHSISARIIPAFLTRISASIKLPLAYAAFSQRKEMIALFLSQGVGTDQVDNRGNNVFHYIADLSSVASDTAIQIFHRMVTQMKGEMKDVRKLIFEERNSAGFTAAEHVAKFGSPVLLNQFLTHVTTVFSASKDHLNMPDDDGTSNNTDRNESSVETECEYRPSDANRIASDVDTRVEEVDVTLFETGYITYYSSLLNILSDREVTSMSESDLNIFNDDELIGTWLWRKFWQMFPFIVYTRLWHIFIFIILPVLTLIGVLDTHNGANMAIFRFQELGFLETNKVRVLELRAWANNTSEIFKPSVYHARVMTTSLELQQNVLSGILAESPSKLHHLLNITSLEHVLLTPDTKALSHWNISSSVGDYARAMDILYEVAKEMLEFSGNMHDWRIARLYPRFVQELAAKVYENRDWIFKRTITLYEMKTTTTFLKNFTLVDDDGDILNPPVNFSIGSFLDNLCPSLHELQQSDFQYLSNLPLEYFQTYQEMNACLYYVLVRWLNGTKQHPCSASKKELDKILNKVTWFRTLRYTEPEFYIGSSTYCFSLFCIYLLIFCDIYERCFFFFKSMGYQTTLKDMILTAFGHGKKVPGSYLYKQLYVLSLIAWLTERHVYIIEATQEKANIQLIEFVNIVTSVFRLTTFIYLLRLLPGIGHFIITAFMIAANILHFCIVLGIVVVIFAVIFRGVVENPDCPLFMYPPGFETHVDSIFSTFQLTHGHGELGPFFSSTPAKLTYVVYMLIVGLLLLNLVIALMSTMIKKSMADQRKDVLWKIEMLKEATSAQFTAKLMKLNFIVSFWCKLLRCKNPFKIHKIKMFYYPSMRDRHNTF